MAELPIKISKNVEMTGERTRAYDVWRAKLALDFIGLPFVEYSRLQSRAWPRFAINAVVLPCWHENSLRHAVSGTMANSHSYSKSIISLVESGVFPKEFPIFDVSFAPDFRSFECRSVGEINGNQMNSNEFIKTVLKQTPKEISGPLVFENASAAYSAWHRVAMPSSAGLMDIDFIELRNGEPVALIEATKSNSGDLEYGLFSFLSRGFAQASIYIQLAELLSTDAYVVTESPRIWWRL